MDNQTYLIVSLQQLGKSAESYLNDDDSDKILSHKDLLRTFGAGEELADEMLNDQGKTIRYHLLWHNSLSMITCYMNFISSMYGFELFNYIMEFYFSKHFFK